MQGHLIGIALRAIGLIGVGLTADHSSLFLESKRAASPPNRSAAYRPHKSSLPLPPAYHHARGGNRARLVYRPGGAVLRFAPALRVPPAARGDLLEASGRGTSVFRAPRGFSSPAAHRTGNMRFRRVGLSDRAIGRENFATEGPLAFPIGGRHPRGAKRPSGHLWGNTGCPNGSDFSSFPAPHST